MISLHMWSELHFVIDDVLKVMKGRYQNTQHGEFSYHLNQFIRGLHIKMIQQVG